MLNKEQLFVKAKCARTHFNIEKKTLYLSVKVVSTKVLVGDTPFAQFSADQRRGERTTRFSGCKGG